MANRRRAFTYDWFGLAGALGVTTKCAKQMAARGKFDPHDVASVLDFARRYSMSKHYRGLTSGNRELRRRCGAYVFENLPYEKQVTRLAEALDWTTGT